MAKVNIGTVVTVVEVIVFGQAVHPRVLGLVGGQGQNLRKRSVVNGRSGHELFEIRLYNRADSVICHRY